jgi:hypothetical protein
MPDQRKPWYRPRNVLALLLAIAVFVFAWALSEALHVYRAKPQPSVDTPQRQRDLFADHAGVASDVGEESWARLAEILDLTDEAGEPLPEGLASLHERGVFDRLEAFANGPPGLQPLRGGRQSDTQALLADCGRARNLARFGALAMRRAANEGDDAGAATACDHTLAVGRTMAWQPFLISYLSGGGIEALALAELRYELMEADFDEPACRALLASLDRHEAFPPVAYALEAERIYFQDYVQWNFTDDGAGDGYLTAPQPSIFGAVMSRFVMPTRLEITAAHDALMDELVRQSRLPAAEQSSGVSARELVEGLPSRYQMVRMLAEPLARVVHNDRSRLARVEGTRVMVALALSRAQHGAYPEALDRLGAEGTTVTPFAYRLTPGDPQGRPYLLTTPRPDGRGDIIINEPRPP